MNSQAEFESLPRNGQPLQYLLPATTKCDSAHKDGDKSIETTAMTTGSKIVSARLSSGHFQCHERVGSEARRSYRRPRSIQSSLAIQLAPCPRGAPFNFARAGRLAPD